MSAKIALEIVKQNAIEAERSILQLKNELKTITTVYNNLKCNQLREENEKLSLAVEAAKKSLINLEIKNGVKQIDIALTKPVKVPDETEIKECDTQMKSEKKLVSKKKTESKQKSDVPDETEIKECDTQMKSEKKLVSKKKTESKQKSDDTKRDVEVIDIGRLDLRVAKIEHVQKHPDADTLYVLKINCGEDKPRTVCSALVKFVPIEQLEDSSVLLLCNLKSVKMRGITSEAMIMCASRPDAIEVLIPPPGCVPGEAVHCDGYSRNPDLIMNPKKKIFETVVPDLATNDALEACYKGIPFNVAGKGYIRAATLKNCPIK